MGICGEYRSRIILEGSLGGHASPMTEIETEKLLSYKSATCKIKFEKGFGTGFFCEINEERIPFKKALFTNNHILNENSIQNEIEFEYCGENKKIKINDRYKFTDKELDYTCIEIFENDGVNNYFKIERSFEKDSEIFILQYPNGNFSHASGKIIDINNERFLHSASTDNGSSGSPLIKRNCINSVIGIHYGRKMENEKITHNLGTSFEYIIKDITDTLSGNNIKLKYNTNNKDKNRNRIFGTKFVENNRENIKLVINGKQNALVEEYDLKKGDNDIETIINKDLTYLNWMFNDVISLKNIKGLIYFIFIIFQLRPYF